jgi:phage tail sheath protein FI
MPTVLSYPGVYIEELPSAVRTITGVPTSIAAFVGRAWKGPVDTPVTVNSLADYERTFGGLWAGSSMSYAISQFFANGGGQAIVVRVVRRTDPGTAANTTKFAITGGTKLEARSPGSWGNNLTLTVDTTTNPDLPADTGRFHLTILDDPDRKEDSAKRGGSGAQESFPNVSVTATSPRYILRVLAEQSKLVRVQDGLATNVGGSAPSGNATVNNTGPGAGHDGSDIVTNDVKGDSGTGTGMYALSRADLFNLLCLPPPTIDTDHDPGLWPDAAKFCKDERAVVLVDAIRTWDVAGAAAAVVAAPFSSNAAKANAALYFPRLRMPDALAENALTDFVPCGVVAGVIARTDTERGVWKAPAGIETSVAGVFGTSVNGQKTTLIDADSGTLNPLAVNVIRDVPGVGPVVWGARTMDGRDLLASQWKYLPVRRTALYIEESLYRGTQWVVFEPNDEPLWAQIRMNVGAFMHGLFRQGAFQGTTPREAYLVKCDKETTTQDDINRGVVNILVGFAPLKPAEFVVLKIQQLAGQIQS